LKLVIGNYINDGTSKNYWNASERHTTVLGESTILCGEPPTVNAAYLEDDCASNNEPCLFNISNDPCEYADLSGEYPEIVTELLEELKVWYDAQSTQLQRLCGTNKTASDPALFGGV